MSRRWILSTVFLLATFSPTLAEMAGHSSFVLTQKADGYSIEYTPKVFPSTVIDVAGQQHTLYLDAGPTADGDEGNPMLPVDILSLGVPFGARVAAMLVDPVYDAAENQLIAPSPHYELRPDSSMVPMYEKDEQAYGANRLYPSDQIVVGQSFTLRQQHIAAIRIFPYQYNPVTKSLRRLIKAKLDVRFAISGGSAPSGSADERDPHFEQVYESLIANYEQAKAWRQSVALKTTAPPDSTRDWFQTGRDYYRIPVANDGWYRITKADIAAAGGNPSLIDVPTVKLYVRGAEIPCLIRPDTTIEFYAMRKYGDSTYFDFWTDTNAYWLTWGGTPGQRYLSQPQHSGTPTSTISSSTVTRHFEENPARFNGADPSGLEANMDDDEVPGKTWRWTYYFPNNEFPHIMAVDTVDAIGSLLSQMRVWFFGANQIFNPPPISHRARVWINDSLVGEKAFAQRSGALLDTTFPSAWLVNGTNVLKVRSIETAAFPNNFYLDWIELDYRRFIVATGNQVTFTSPASGSSPVQFVATGFSSALIDVFDLTGDRQITGGTITGSDEEGYTIRFKDTLSIQKKYVVVAASGQRPVLPMTKKQFLDIRVNNVGADYVIITHRNFKNAATQLAQARQTLNGVRTAVIDVQDTYDEFNYGVMSDLAVKKFLRYAYEHWPSPAPTYALMFGKACRDPHAWEAVTTNYNYVPGHNGFPTGDNWFVCFDDSLTFVPSMIIGRISISDSSHASRMVAKVLRYEDYTLGAWNKNYLFITGPVNAGEPGQFAENSNSIINTFVAPPPLGGNTYRAYKTSHTPTVDVSKRDEIQGIINNGVVLMHYLGHAATQVWGLDIGNPHNLQNTGGEWPFVIAVSCNTGTFATAGGRSLGEDLALADFRGAIAEWGAAAFGYEFYGRQLALQFLSAVAIDSMRGLGALTTTSRIRMWQTFGTSVYTIAHLRYTPLIGDPLTRLAIPFKPDLALPTGSISVNKSIISSNDSTVAVKLVVSNYGLVPLDSVQVRLIDTYNGQVSTLVNDVKLAAPLYRDSVLVPWEAPDQVGLHTLGGSVDPNNLITEVNEANNTTSANQYVYANLLAIVKPFNNMVMPAGIQALVVTSPLGLDSLGLQYFFELDTVETFDSPFLVSSGPVNPGVVSGVWTTPVLQDGKVYFWRARTMLSGTLGNWVTSTFSTSIDLPASPQVRWREKSKKQFVREELLQTAATDSGVTILPNPIADIRTLSLGNRNGTQNEYYSTIRVNESTLLGYPWIVGRGFIGMRLDHTTGTFIFKAFDVPSSIFWAESLRSFIDLTPVGNYLAFAVVLDGRTNTTENLYLALESIGSTLIRTVQPGQSWTLIGRKGSGAPGMTPIESLTNDSAKASYSVLPYFSSVSGSFTTKGMFLPSVWGSFHWRNAIPANASGHVALLGIRPTGVVEKLRVIPRDTTDVDLSFLTSALANQNYSSFRSSVYLSTNDLQVSPRLSDWWMDFTAPADLAVSARTIGLTEVTVEKGSVLNLPVTVHNIGFQGADSAHITVSMYDKLNKARTITVAHLDTIPVNGFKTATIPISTANFSRRVTLQIAVTPSVQKRDLVAENNVAYYTFNVTGNEAAPVRFYADGVQLMDGDYVSPRPSINIQLNDERTIQKVEFYVDNTPLAKPHPVVPAKGDAVQPASRDDLSFNPVLPDGRHEMTVRFHVLADDLGNVDTLQQSMSVQVLSENRVMQLYNYPNPFSRETDFTFILTGAALPDGLVIRVYTIAGRKIREISVLRSQLQFGFNRVHWDGRDNDGDEIANGYYLYQVSVKADGKMISAIEKLVKVR